MGLRQHERAEETKDTAEGQMARVLLDHYFATRGDWSKIEQRITDAARDHKVDVAGAAELVKMLTALKLTGLRALPIE